MIRLILINIIILFLFYYINKNIYQQENFITFYKFLNDSFEKKKTVIKQNNKDISISKKYNNFNNLFLKNIYLTYTEKSNNFIFYIFNYEHKLIMKINIDKNMKKFDIFDEENQNIGKLIKTYHNKYYIDLQKLYKNDYKFIIKNEYKDIEIINDFDSKIYKLSKNDNNENILYKLMIYDEEIGHIKNNNKYYKIFIKNNYLDNIYLYCYALCIIIINKKE